MFDPFGALIDFASGILSPPGSDETGQIDQEITRTQSDISIFEMNRSEYLSNQTSLQSDVCDFQGQQTGAQAQVSETQQAISSAQGNVSAAQSALSAAMSIQPKVIQNEDGTTTVDTSQRDAAIAAATAQLEQAKAQLSEATASNVEAQEKLNEILTQIESLQATLEGIKGDIDGIDSQLSAAKSQLLQLNQQLVQARQKESQGKNNIQELGTEEMKRMTETYLTLTNLDPNREVSQREIDQATKIAEIIANSDYDKTNPEIARYVETARLLTSKGMNEEPEEGQVYNETQLQVRANIRNMTIDYLQNQGFSQATATAITNAYLDIGHHEEGDNEGIQMEKYYRDAATQSGINHEPWCASFVSWLYGEGAVDPEGMTNPTEEYNNTFGYQISVAGIQNASGGYFTPSSSVNDGTYTPVPGDIMIQGTAHTGMVVGADDNYIYTIEGNAGDQVRTKRYARNGDAYQKITGYVRMNEWTGGNSDPNTVYLIDPKDFEDADGNPYQSTI